ncbi:hypothetical protein QN277_015128 [Acacia crassicarpa]|uniref:Uncharacterized protein n=1 Tax=Acacia crassicarpa TaxID=499986 RepID=A0AAE1MVE1_9FABA|nr:hypothetical protein QN277_015128 [Acacia crassicarpa]
MLLQTTICQFPGGENAGARSRNRLFPSQEALNPIGNCSIASTTSNIISFAVAPWPSFRSSIRRRSQWWLGLR